MEEIKDLYRVRLYERCNILAVDLTDIIKEIKLFVDEKVIPELKENDCDKFIFSGLELRKEDDKFVWSVYDSNELSDLKSKEITLDDINIEFKGKKEFLKSLEENHNIENFPKELYGKAFMVFAETVTEIINSDKLYDEINLFDIFTLTNNDINNIIF